MNVKCDIRVDRENVVDFMKRAFRSGIYQTWCEGCNQIGNDYIRLGKAEFLVKGGELEFAVRKPFEMDGDGREIRYYTLTLEKLLGALGESISGFATGSFIGGMVSMHTGQYTDNEAQEVLQEALFGEVIY